MHCKLMLKFKYLLLHSKIVLLPGERTLHAPSYPLCYTNHTKKYIRKKKEYTPPHCTIEQKIVD